MMTAKSQIAIKNLTKKVKKRTVCSSNSVVAVLSSCRGKKLGLTHANLRHQILWSSLRKFHKLSNTSSVMRDKQFHGVELTDDIVIFDSHGLRILTPEYAKIPIDKLPRFQKG